MKKIENTGQEPLNKTEHERLVTLLQIEIKANETLRKEHERTAELLKQERNKAIDDVIEKLCTSVEFGCIDRRWEYVKQDLESLKLKSE